MSAPDLRRPRLPSGIAVLGVVDLLAALQPDGSARCWCCGSDAIRVSVNDFSCDTCAAWSSAPGLRWHVATEPAAMRRLADQHRQSASHLLREAARLERDGKGGAC